MLTTGKLQTNFGTADFFEEVLEKAAQQALKDYFEHKNLLSKSQHRFRKKHSTKTASIYFCDSIRKQINNGKLTGAVYVDLSKAFETIGRSVPLQKLSVYVVMYADDTVLYVSHESKEKIENDLNQDMQNLLSYFRKNELVINLKK